jgi:hypothetical protein
MYIVRNGLPLLEWLGAPFLEHVGSGLFYTLLLSLLFLRHSQRFCALSPASVTASPHSPPPGSGASSEPSVL